VGTNLRFGGGCPVAEELIPEVQHKPDSGGHTADGDDPIGSRVNDENDIGDETKHSSARPARGHT